MKLPLAVALSLLACAAQAAVITPLGRSPLAGLPTVLPSPLSGPFAGAPSVLPAPTLLPTLALPAAAVPAAAPAPVAAPAVLPTLPAVRVNAERENAPQPLRRVLPDATVRFATASPAQGSPEAEKARQDRVFDGEKEAPAGVIVPRREPSVSGRHVSLPEWDLENEIGAY